MQHRAGSHHAALLHVHRSPGSDLVALPQSAPPASVAPMLPQLSPAMLSGPAMPHSHLYAVSAHDHPSTYHCGAASSSWDPPIAAAAYAAPSAPPLATGMPAHLSPSVSPASGLQPLLHTPPSGALTVGDILGAFPSTSTSSPGPPVARTLAARRASSGGFEADHIVEGPIGLTPRVKPFIAKLNHLVSYPECYQDCVVWDSSGESFIINANRRFVNEVLPRLFGHTNAASFTRQLNVYGFRRLTNSELLSRVDVASVDGYSGWSHPHFSRDDKSRLHLLTPRPSRARLIKKAEKQERLDREQSEKERRARAVQEAAANAAARAGSADAYPTPRLSPWMPLAAMTGNAPEPPRAGYDSSGSSASHSSLPSPLTPPTNTLGLIWPTGAYSLAPSTNDPLAPSTGDPLEGPLR
ncbi:hypothetical protein JCM3770_002139 [Rhodotorula araucariae]